MKLSVIVVNRNMCSLLKQCLPTLIRACQDIEHQIIVIDDSSTDKSVEMVKTDFPEVSMIVNEQSIGMAASRNLGTEKAKSEYVLLVNADIISGKKTVEQVVQFMEGHPDAGAVGVRALTPRGRFMPESRTGFGRSWATLLKITGLAKYFPKSRLYKNEERWINEDEFATTEVDVINGAFMLLRRSALNKIGKLDERFIQFGHDIDLSFRLRLAGYKNYYYPRTYILNFAKQLTSKFTLDYIRKFYGAMIIFAGKYLFKMPEIKVPGIPQMFAPKYEIER
ncbi:glycosyltransferase family 2 protein [Mucilaginibacter achroorhodeus]|uniref:Glycosyltransferase family 2 protein n=1 Tax=Mucilaginibacter achroorhodeus TaxID=2599294 RepID=A0A563U3Y4_9SPHI|nr:glycosyltransferase family 2 protein [Mucilaginibacter achroorhodeus]TWR26066.1 glycosyltransferase family 2 protein [Mucilaginibacter achroorhodeus]